MAILPQNVPEVRLGAVLAVCVERLVSTKEVTMNIYQFEMKNHDGKGLLILIHPDHEEQTVYVNILNGDEPNKKTEASIEIKLTSRQFIYFCKELGFIGQQFQMASALHSCDNCTLDK